MGYWGQFPNFSPEKIQLIPALQQLLVLPFKYSNNITVKFIHIELNDVSCNGNVESGGKGLFSLSMSSCPYSGLLHTSRC